MPFSKTENGRSLVKSTTILIKVQRDSLAKMPTNAFISQFFQFLYEAVEFAKEKEKEEKKERTKKEEVNEGKN